MVTWYSYQPDDSGNQLWLIGNGPIVGDTAAQRCRKTAMTQIRRVADKRYREVVMESAQRLLSWRMNHAERVLANTLLTEDGVVEHRGPRR